MKRILAISDIHGCLDKFNAVLEKAAYNPAEDQLILLGDYIDRGPQSFEVVQKVKELVKGGAVALKGNHEFMAVNALQGSGQSGLIWLSNGGEKTLRSYADNKAAVNYDLQFFDSLPLFFETKDYIFVHAGLNPRDPFPGKTSEQDMLWIREEWLNCEYAGKPVIFGHTPMEGGVRAWPDGKRIAIDSGAVHYDCLSCLELPGMRVYAAMWRRREVQACFYRSSLF